MGMVFYNSFTKYYDNITTVSESKRGQPGHRLRDGKRAVNNSRKKGFPSEAFGCECAVRMVGSASDNQGNDPEDQSGEEGCGQEGDHLLVIALAFLPGLADVVQLFAVHEGDDLLIGMDVLFLFDLF